MHTILLKIQIINQDIEIVVVHLKNIKVPVNEVEKNAIEKLAKIKKEDPCGPDDSVKIEFLLHHGLIRVSPSPSLLFYSEKKGGTSNILKQVSKKT